MPKLSVFTMRVALLNFALGWTFGAWLLASRGAPHLHPGFDLLHPHISLMTLGAMTQIVFAVAYWILPREGRVRPRPALAVIAFILLNLASWVGAVVQWTLWSITLAIVAAGFFIAHAWPRVRAFGVRPAKSVNPTVRSR